VDKGVSDLVKKAIKSGRWVEANGRKHLKLVMRDNAQYMVVVTGSSCDPERAKKNFTSDVRRLERAAGFSDYSI
jgi:hypothetical protein